MKTYHLFRILPFLAIATAAADTFELKDGTKFEGAIVKEEGSDYIVAVQITKTIKDEKRIPKADVVKHTAEKKDETDFEDIAVLVPTPDLKSAESYASDLRKVEAFIKKYPDSPKKKDAAKIIDTLGDELAVIKDGGVKFGGKMISASARAPKAYGLDASILAQQLTESGDKSDYLTALRAWTKLETGFPGSKAYRDNIPYVVKLMRAYQGVVTTALGGLDARVKARASGLAGMDGSNRSRSEQAIKEEQDAYLARVTKEKAEGTKWLSLDPYVKAPLDETKRYLDTEIRRLETIDLTYASKAEEAYDEAYAAVTKPGATKQDVDTALSKARSANIPPAYIEILTKAAPAAPAP
jgi:hypothetical protein